MDGYLSVHIVANYPEPPCHFLVPHVYAGNMHGVIAEGIAEAASDFSPSLLDVSTAETLGDSIDFKSPLVTLEDSDDGREK